MTSDTHVQNTQQQHGWIHVIAVASPGRDQMPWRSIVPVRGQRSPARAMRSVMRSGSRHETASQPASRVADCHSGGTSWRTHLVGKEAPAPVPGVHHDLESQERELGVLFALHAVLPRASGTKRGGQAAAGQRTRQASKHAHVLAHFLNSLTHSRTSTSAPRCSSAPPLHAGLTRLTRLTTGLDMAEENGRVLCKATNNNRLTDLNRRSERRGATPTCGYSRVGHANTQDDLCPPP